MFMKNEPRIPQLMKKFKRRRNLEMFITQDDQITRDVLKMKSSDI